MTEKKTAEKTPADERAEAREALIVETPSGKKVNTGRLVMGVGYTYSNGDPLTDDDRAFVDAEIKKREKAKP